MSDDVDTVATLLAVAGLTVPDNEVERLAQLYPGLRRSVDRMYEIDTGDEVPASLFQASEAREAEPRASETTSPAGGTRLRGARSAEARSGEQP